MRAGIATTSLDVDLVDRLRAGDESAFTWLVDNYSAPLMRVAGTFVSSAAAAEDVVQETWMAVLTGITRFEARSSFKTWLFAIVVNRAKSRALRESRTIPFSAFDVAEGNDEPAVEPSRFLPADHPRWPHHWSTPPRRWSVEPESAALEQETLAVLKRALEALPQTQRMVVALRDIHGWSASEVSAALGLGDVNQRVLLHRGRSRLRADLETYFADRLDREPANV